MLCNALCVMKDFEWEIIEVELSGLGADGELGFELAGGREQPCYPNDTSVYVTAVTKGSLADGKIRSHLQYNYINNVAHVCHYYVIAFVGFCLHENKDSIKVVYGFYPTIYICVKFNRNLFNRLGGSRLRFN